MCVCVCVCVRACVCVCARACSYSLESSFRSILLAWAELHNICHVKVVETDGKGQSGEKPEGIHT